MDPYGAHAVATSRGQDMARDAEESRLARAARDCHEKPRPEPRPRRRIVRAGRAVTA